jgi:hypothetical protein
LENDGLELWGKVPKKKNDATDLLAGTQAKSNSHDQRKKYFAPKYLILSSSARLLG